MNVADFYSDYTTGQTVWVSNLGRGKGVFSLLRCPYRLWGPHSLLFSLYRSSLLGIKRPGREVNHPHASSAEIKNE